MKGMNMIDVATIDETTVNGFRPGYDVVLVQHFMKKFGWSSDLARRALRDAIRFFTVSAIPPTTGADEVIGWEPRITVSSETVDLVVDEIFLNTPLLTWLETEVFHVRMHHVPAYEHGDVDPFITHIRYMFAIDLMRAAGYEIDDDIWPTRLPADYAACIAGGGAPPCHVRAS